MYIDQTVIGVIMNKYEEFYLCKQLINLRKHSGFYVKVKQQFKELLWSQGIITGLAKCSNM